MHYHPESLIIDLTIKAQAFRIQALKMVYEVQSGHVGGPFSVAEILTCLYFHHLRIDPQRPDWPERDRLLFSKGHASPMFYTVLAHRGYFPVEDLKTFRLPGSRLHGHPDRVLPGVEIGAGPLGQGIAIGAGMAMALRMGLDKPSSFSAPSSRASRARVYVVVGDGETDAGVIWEGAAVAAKYQLGNLAAIMDYNGIQQTGATADVMPKEPVADRWRAFGWHVQEIDGHNVAEILNALDRADEIHAQPSMIIARTTKGKGVSFMEYDHRWHGQAPNREQYKQAVTELEEGLKQWQS
ncbi:MAG: transketolase [Anaerolineales bacterium]|jgi:transketolase